MKFHRLSVFWGDTRVLLSRKERRDVLVDAILESITMREVLLRDRKTNRLIVVTSDDEPNLFCELCKDEVVRDRFGRSCPKFATCLLKGGHFGSNGVAP